MESSQLPDEIRKVAMDLDDALESKDIEQILSCFSDDCEIELLGVKLTGRGRESGLIGSINTSAWLSFYRLP